MRIESKQFQWLLGASLVLLSLIACKSFGGGGTTMPPGIQPNPPTVISCTPPNGSTGIPLNEVVSVTFSEAMNLATLNTSTFLVTSGPAATAVLGEVVCTNARAVFWPTAHLASSSLLTATITTGAKSAAGVPLITNHSWTFTTGSATSVQLSARSPGRALQPGANSSRRQAARIATTHGSGSAIAGDVGAAYLNSDVGPTTTTPAQITQWIHQAEPAPPRSAMPPLVQVDLRQALLIQAQLRQVALRPALQTDPLLQQMDQGGGFLTTRIRFKSLVD
jgi:hypothetical protein